MIEIYRVSDDVRMGIRQITAQIELNYIRTLRIFDLFIIEYKSNRDHV